MATRHTFHGTGILLAALLLNGGMTVTHAASMAVQVLDPYGIPVPEVAVFVDRPAGAATVAPVATAIMDQVDTRFVPHMLVIQKGTAVEFPNSDVVAHHVYSFSKPNNFVLPLYKGDAYAPVTFAHAGVVILGCNIHDAMLGYIVVVDTDTFGITGADGRVTLDVAGGATEYVVNIWSPRIRDAQSLLHQVVSNPSRSDVQVSFELQKKLRPPHASQSAAVQWSDY
jgi:plastocyanin